MIGRRWSSHSSSSEVQWLQPRLGQSRGPISVSLPDIVLCQIPRESLWEGRLLLLMMMTVVVIVMVMMMMMIMG